MKVTVEYEDQGETVQGVLNYEREQDTIVKFTWYDGYWSFGVRQDGWVDWKDTLMDDDLSMQDLLESIIFGAQ